MRSVFLKLLAIGAMLFLGSQAQAWDITKKSEDSGDFKVYIGKQVMGSALWGWDKCGAGAWLHMSCNNSGFSTWELDYDCTQNQPGQIKAFPSVCQGWYGGTSFTSNSGFPKKVDSNLKSKATFKASLTSSSGSPKYNMMVETFGHTGTGGGKVPAWEVMIMIDQSPASGTKYDIDGTKWWKTSWWGNGNAQKCVMYTRVSRTKSTTVNIKPFLDHAEVNKNYSGQTVTTYISSISCGWEIYNGKMKWKTTSMSITP